MMAVSFLRLNQGGADWTDFCDYLDSNNSGWNQLAGLLTVYVNNTELTTNSATVTGSAVVKFVFSQRLIDFLAENTDVTLTYDFTAVCETTPPRPVAGSGSVTNNLEVTINYTSACDTGDQTQVEPFTVTMTTPTNRALFDNYCANQQAITTKSISFSLYINES